MVAVATVGKLPLPAVPKEAGLVLVKRPWMLTAKVPVDGVEETFRAARINILVLPPVTATTEVPGRSK